MCWREEKSQEVEKATRGLRVGLEKSALVQWQPQGVSCHARQQSCRDRISLWDAGSSGSLGRLGCGYSSGSLGLQGAWVSHPCSDFHLMSERLWGKEAPSGKQTVCRGGCQSEAQLLREPPGKSRDEVTPPPQQA